MSRLRFSPDLFIESQELNRFQRFIFEDGFEDLLLKNTQLFGVINNTRDGESFTNGLVEFGTNVGTIKHGELFAIDVNGRKIYKAATDNISLVDNNSWYWLKVRFQDSAIELGTVAVDSSGNVTGDGTTDFTEILRGQPNLASRIAFPNATLNTGEYDVQEVVNSTTLILSGMFVAETNLTLKVVGTFTPGAVPSVNDKDIFRYDSCTMTLVLETVSETPPTLVTDEEFVLARVKRNGATVVVQDKRLLNIYKTKADLDLSNVMDAENPLIGVESVRYDDPASSTRSENQVALSWSFSSNNWTIDTNTNKITLNSGSGGRFRSTSDFTDGDFDGWRCYADDGTYSIVQSSFKSGTQINLILSSLEPTKYSNPAKVVNVTPNFEGIQIQCNPDGSGVGLNCRSFYFPINRASTEGVEFKLPVFDESCQYFIYYRYRTLNTYGTFRSLPDDATGFLNESSFDDGGTQTATNRTPYSGGLITLNRALDAYVTVISTLNTGDLFGVEYVAIDNGNPVTRFEVGARRHHVVITNDADIDSGDSDFGSPYVLTTDIYLDLRRDLPASLKNGNSFIIQFRGEYTLSGHLINIVEGYVNSGNTGVNLYTLTAEDVRAAINDELILVATFDGSTWFIHRYIKTDATLLTVAATHVTTPYTLVLGDKNSFVRMSNAGANSVVVPPNASVPFDVGTHIWVTQSGTGSTSISPGAGVTLRSDAGMLTLTNRFVVVELVKVDTNEWYVYGSLM